MKRRLGLTLILSGLMLCSCAKVNTPDPQRDPSSSEHEDPWTTWSRDNGRIGALLVLSGIRKNLLNNNLHDPMLTTMVMANQ